MDQLFPYLLKSSGLIAVFYVAYHFLVRKETFFNSNRWFLLTGILTSLLLPFYFIRQIVWIERPKIQVRDLIECTPSLSQAAPNIPVAEPFDWMQLLWIGYALIAAVLIVKIAFELLSLYKMLYEHQSIKKQQFKLVNLNKDIAPFSFFNYIVYNPSLYSDEELQSILLHEQIHSKEKHSADVLIAELFCALFWFNPFVWLYKKAIKQNLEYIADQKAIEQLEDKKLYQHALLKVVSNQNCLPITNHFYQSLIKKRIIMLNKNQSNRTSYLKYAIVIPVLVGFMLLFQIEVIARSKPAPGITTTTTSNHNMAVDVIPVCETAPVQNPNNVGYIIDKITTDEDLEETVADLKNIHNIELVISNVKRDDKGEIISITMAFDDKKGNKGKVEQNRTIAIRPIFFKVNKLKDGRNDIGFFDNPDMILKPADPVNESKITTIESIKEDALIYVDGQRYDKETLNELDPKGLEKIEILKDESSLAQYGAKSKAEVVVITTNWTTRQEKPKPSVNIITIANGDEVTVFDRFNVKVPGYPTVQFTESSPIMIVNGVQQKNPRLTLESMPLSKIKDIKVLNDKDVEAKGTPIYKMIITTK